VLVAARLECQANVPLPPGAGTTDLLSRAETSTRRIEEVPGHIPSAGAEYCQISRAWHSWLGFTAFVIDSASKDAVSNSKPGPSLKLPLLTEKCPNETVNKRVCNPPLE
jgi:hypothetical protein